MWSEYIDYFASLVKTKAVLSQVFFGVLAIGILIILIFPKIKKTDVSELIQKNAISAIVLVFIFVLPQMIAINLDLKDDNSIVTEQNAVCTVDNNVSLANGFDYFMFYNSVKLQNGNSKVIFTILKRLPDGKNTVNITYTKHSHLLLNYEIVDT